MNIIDVGDNWEWSNYTPQPLPFMNLVNYLKVYTRDEFVWYLEFMAEHVTAEGRTFLDEDILAAVSLGWPEDVCDRYYEDLNK